LFRDFHGDSGNAEQVVDGNGGSAFWLIRSLFTPCHHIGVLG
jgi:hypothetical protein